HVRISVYNTGTNRKRNCGKVEVSTPEEAEMIMRGDQIKVFESNAENEFVNRLIHYLQQKHPARIEDLDDENRHRRVCAAIAKARANGFTWESSIAGFVALMFELTPEFDRHPAFHAALEKRHADENERIRAIYRTVTDKDWEEARALSGPDSWSALEGNG